MPIPRKSHSRNQKNRSYPGSLNDLKEELERFSEYGEDFPILNQVFNEAGDKVLGRVSDNSSLYSDAGQEHYGESQDEYEYEYEEDESTISDDDKSFHPKVIETPDVSMRDIGGLKEVKEEINRIIDFMGSPGKYRQKGASLPKGVLLSGPPGTGKTTLAKAMANESGTPMIEVSGPDFDASVHGYGRARVQKLFQLARQNIEEQKQNGVKDPFFVIFIDEIDTIGMKRSMIKNASSTQEMVMMELARQMDGFSSTEGIMVLAATNKPELLDPALIRSGRFDEHLEVPAPDKKGRLEILKILTRKRNMPLKKDVDFDEIAGGTFGFCGAELNKLVNKAAIIAAEKENLRKIGMTEFREAYHYVLKGPRRHLNMLKHDKESTAIHEAGHALVGLALEKQGSTPLRHVTILPHTGSLGTTYFMQENEEHSHTLRKFKAELALTYAGRIAEELAYGPDNISSGASGDIDCASEILWKMVTQYGFNETLGAISYDHISISKGYYDGADWRGLENMPDTMATQIYKEMRKLEKEAQDKAREILVERYDSLISLAQGLMEWEVLDREDVIEYTGIKPEKPVYTSLASLAKNVHNGPPGLTAD